MNGLRKKYTYTHTHTHTHTMECYSGTVRNKMMAFAGKWKDLEIVLNKITQVQRDKVYIFSLVC
jgi:hypothetical protein